MTVTFSFFLIVYLVFLFIIGIFSLFNLFHMFRFGLTRVTGVLATTIYVAGIVFIISTTFALLSDVPWGQQVHLFELPNSNNLTIPLYGNE